jgi:hypothetical protein
VCCAFVDDTDVIHSARTQDTQGEEVMGEMHVVLDRWGGALRATGGALAPSKSCWCAIDFRWNGKRWIHRTTEEMPGDIFITGGDGRRVTLTRHEPDVGKETLGVMQAMDGNDDEEVLHLRRKADDFAESMRTGCLSKNDAWFALAATIMKTLEYPMATTTLSEKEWDHILVPILKAGLPRSGIDRSFPRDIFVRSEVPSRSGDPPSLVSSGNHSSPGMLKTNLARRYHWSSDLFFSGTIALGGGTSGLAHRPQL